MICYAIDYDITFVTIRKKLERKHKKRVRS